MPLQYSPLPKDKRILKFNQKQKFVNIILNKFPDAGALKQELFSRKDLNSVMLAHKIDEDWSFEEYQRFLTRNLSYKIADRQMATKMKIKAIVQLMIAGVIILTFVTAGITSGDIHGGVTAATLLGSPFLGPGAKNLGLARIYNKQLDDHKTDEIRTPGFRYECVCEAFDKHKQFFNDESNIQYKFIFQNYLNKVNKCIEFLKEEFKIETDVDIKRNIRYDVNKLNRIKTDLERIVSLDYTNYEFYQLYQSTSYFKNIPHEIRNIVSKYR